jgi:hypothetical protein
MEEQVPSHAAPSVLKGAAIVMELICERVARGEESLADAVAEASRRIEMGGARPFPPLRAASTKPADAIDAEYAPVAPAAASAAPSPALAKSTAPEPWRPTPASPDSPCLITAEQRWRRR